MNKPTFQRQMSRHLIVIAGVAILLWSGVEDGDARAVSALGALTAAGLTLALLNRKRGGSRPQQCDALAGAALAGATVGTLSALSATLLMLFKNLRHAHVFPDFPPAMMMGMLERLPAWALAGALAGLGLGILLRLWAALRPGRH